MVTAPLYASQDTVFGRLEVDHLVAGGTRVSWDISGKLCDNGPYAFTLQVGETANPDADDWQDVGGPVENVNYAIDDERRLSGSNPTTTYRVRLQTPSRVAYSRGVSVYEKLGVRDWSIAQELQRKELLRVTDFVGVPGRLLMRRRRGADLPPEQARDPRVMVKDPITGEIIRHASTITNGAEFVGGYYKPIPFSIDMAPAAINERVEDQMRGSVDTDAMITSGRAVFIPGLAKEDIFIADGSDLRYEVCSLKFAAQWRGMPLVVDPLELRLLPFSDIAYRIDPAAL